MVRTRSYMYAPLLHPASTPTYLPQGNTPFRLECMPKFARPWGPTVCKPKNAFTRRTSCRKVTSSSSPQMDSGTTWLRRTSCAVYLQLCSRVTAGRRTVGRSRLRPSTWQRRRGMPPERYVPDWESIWSRWRRLGHVTVVTKDSRNSSEPKTAAHR